MRKHGERITVNFGIDLTVNVCKNPKCEAEFILHRVMHNGDVWEQTGNKIGLLHCPYCSEKVGAY
ncbi:hypothetical protein EVU96_08655 [Bacillus infantis]|uniref:hypothetical protein n=1 Tax=Bacillus infantis TaxID=324767 RepID=UPI00101DB07D|nr:hypothetical protein [Bacillus infantis]RYI30473.1 hypothetical protein EVU96_08655 [Bacillus infantis]